MVHRVRSSPRSPLSCSGSALATSPSPSPRPGRAPSVVGGSSLSATPDAIGSHAVSASAPAASLPSVPVVRARTGQSTTIMAEDELPAAPSVQGGGGRTVDNGAGLQGESQAAAQKHRLSHARAQVQARAEELEPSSPREDVDSLDADRRVERRARRKQKHGGQQAASMKLIGSPAGSVSSRGSASSSGSEGRQSSESRRWAKDIDPGTWIVFQSLCWCFECTIYKKTRAVHHQLK